MLARQLMYVCTLVILMCLGLSSARAGMSYIVIEAKSGTVINQKDADSPWYPASLTKLMTLYLAFQSLEEKHLSESTLLNVSAQAARQPPMKIGVKSGDSLSVHTAVKILTTISSNDVAVVLAEGMGGSESEFVKKMNAQARLLGMKDTQFANATGLPDAKQITSARDMAILARHLLKDYPQYYHFFSTRSVSYKGVSFQSHNGFLSRYPGADGFKTGYTCGSGYNLVASAKKNNRRLITVVLGAESLSERKKTAVSLMDDSFGVDADYHGLPLLHLRGSVRVNMQAPEIIQGRTCQKL